MSSFEELLDLAQQAEFSGWDFSFLNERSTAEPLPWDFRMLVEALCSKARSMLDLGTGGGEFLASLSLLPPETHATESYPPNQSIAKERLEPLGVQVCTEFSDDHLPFLDAYFDLIINRHESYHPAEVLRILKPGGIFFTQQVGDGDNIRFNELLADGFQPEVDVWNAGVAAHQLREAGFSVVLESEAFTQVLYKDIAALIYYLRAIPWQIEGFNVEAYREKLERLHKEMERDGGLNSREHRFLLKAIRSG